MLWIAFTLTAAIAQTFRNAMQRELVSTLGTAGATYVRFLFGLPFALLFLAVVAGSVGALPPLPGAAGFGWALAGSLSQILATGLMLAAMRDKSFVVTTAYTKTEPVQVALFGLVFLGDRLGPMLLLAIAIATAGVVLLSWPQKQVQGGSLKPAALGLVSGAFFAISAIGFRGAILALDTPHFVLAASTVLVTGLLIQSGLIGVWLSVFDRRLLLAIVRARRPSLLAGFMGAFASQFWFLGFAVASAAQVRTLALVEVIFAQIVSRKIFRQGTSRRELLGMALIALGVVVLLNV